MTGMDESDDTASVILAARRSIRAHAAGRLCHFGCPGDETCAQHVWACETIPDPEQR